MSTNEKSVVTITKPRNHAPIELFANEWIELITPDRVRKSPKIASSNASATRIMFQTRSIPLRSWIITECRKAVAASQGISAAFSTGSHA